MAEEKCMNICEELPNGCADMGLNCCDCGGEGCGCCYCWSCNACEECLGDGRE